MTKQKVVIDCAGAFKGGAARFLRELKSYLSTQRPKNVRLIGEGKQLTARWLVRREIAAIGADLRISLNNAGFINPRGRNLTLLRNILQFATEEDLEKLAFTRSKRLRVQTPVIRTLARASHTLVVPCTRMAEQVSLVSPHLENKLVVRFHPVAQPEWSGQAAKNPRDILVPIVPAPYKNLEQHIAELLEASNSIEGPPIRVIVTATEDQLPTLAGHPRIAFIGLQNSEQLERFWKDSGSIFFPTEFESFGYALAEARVYGRNVIAQDTAQNHEIAGAALCPYNRTNKESLYLAVKQAVGKVVLPDPHAFFPHEYFDWLLDRRRTPVD